MDESFIFLELYGLLLSGMVFGKVLGFVRDEKIKIYKKYIIVIEYFKRVGDMVCKVIKGVI